MKRLICWFRGYHKSPSGYIDEEGFLIDSFKCATCGKRCKVEGGVGF